MATTMAVKASGASASLLTSEFDKNQWIQPTITDGILSNPSSFNVILRNGIGFLRVNCALSSAWKSEEVKTICTLPETAWPLSTMVDLVHAGRWFVTVAQDGTVTMQNKSGSDMTAGIGMNFTLGYPLVKSIGGGVKNSLLKIIENLKCYFGGLACQ